MQSILLGALLAFDLLENKKLVPETQKLHIENKINSVVKRKIVSVLTKVANFADIGKMLLSSVYEPKFQLAGLLAADLSLSRSRSPFLTSISSSFSLICSGEGRFMSRMSMSPKVA